MLADARQKLAEARSAKDPDIAAAAYKQGYEIYLRTIL